jgi:hypothetical protein
MRISLDVARLRYGLDDKVFARVENRLLRGSMGARSQPPTIFNVGDIEEAIMVERDVDICPNCGTPYRADARRCEACLLCLMCED